MPADTTDAAPLVYVSDAPTNTALTKFVTVDGFLPEKEGSKEWARLLETFRAHKDGRHVDPDRLPRAFYGDYSDTKQGRLPHLFNANGFWCVSAKCAEVLARFDLGAGGTRPIEAFQHDRTTPIEGQYAVLNFGAQKTTLVAEQSPGVRLPMGWNELMRALKLNFKDGDITVSASALGGADLWVDPHLDRALFLSAPLADALKEARVATPWGLKTCRMVRE